MLTSYQLTTNQQPYTAASAHFLPADPHPAAIHSHTSVSQCSHPTSKPLSQQYPDEEPTVYQSDDMFSDHYFINNWNDTTDEDSDYLTSHSWDVQTTYCGSSSGTSTAISTGTGSGSGTSTDTSSSNEGFLSPLHHLGGSGESGTQTIPPPPFSTPPKLHTMEHVMNKNPRSDVASLRILTVALGRDAIFGKDELATKSLSGRKNMGVLNPDKLIKTLIYSRVPQKSPVELEYIWTLCRTSLSKPCQMLQTKRRL